MATTPPTLSTINGNQIYPVTKIENILVENSEYSIGDKLDSLNEIETRLSTIESLFDIRDNPISSILSRFGTEIASCKTRLDKLESDFSIIIKGGGGSTERPGVIL